MFERQCISCKINKEISFFIRKSKVCRSCLKKADSSRVVTIKNKDHKDSLSINKDIDTIIEIVNNPRKINNHPLHEELARMSKSDFLSKFSKREILELIEELEFIESFEDDIDNDDEFEENENIIDTFEILKRYTNGQIFNNDENESKPNEIWRNNIPIYLKKKYRAWKTASIVEVYEQTNYYISITSGEIRTELFGYSCDLSSIIFDDQDEEDNEDKIDDLSPEIADYIMYMVESIILPHLEVLDRIHDKGGDITFANVWNIPFTESLKVKIKDRDGWKCVICKYDQDLHVHHKIPRKLGGVHHKDNLVTLCSSCHSAIETVDVKHAFSKCLNNYRRSFARGIKQEALTHDITLLKEEVDNTLNKILSRTINKGDKELSELIVSVIDKLEIIFND